MDIDALKEELHIKTEFSYSRSGGPGGQNVNKRDTKVTLRLPVDALETPGSSGIIRIKSRLSHRINNEGFLILQADGERSQARNREEAMIRLEKLIIKALRPDPKPRKKTKPSRAAKERRIMRKKKRSRVKKERARVSRDSDE